MNEIVNDKDGFVCNVWRALQHAPDKVARFADWPMNHADLMARRRELLAREKRLLIKLIANPKYYDAEFAGYWIWCASSWIGSDMLSVSIPNISDHRQGVHSSALREEKRPQIGKRGSNTKSGVRLYEWFEQLQTRLRDVIVVCGDWSQVCGGNWQHRLGDVGIFFDPPYGVKDRSDVYRHDSSKVARDVMIWCLEHGPHPNYRIALCGYDEHEPLLRAGWTFEEWAANGGYANRGDGQGRKNKRRERIYYSPHCLRPHPELFDV